MQKYLSKIKRYIIISLICYSLETLVTSIILFLPGYLVDHYLEGVTTIRFLIACYVLLFSLYLLIAYSSNRISDYRRIKFEKYIKKDFFDSVIERNYQDYYQYDVGEYLSMQANDITEMCQNYLSPLLSVYRSIIMIIVFGISLVLFVNVSIALVIILCSVLAVFIPELTASKLSKRNGIYLKKIGRYTSSIKTYFEAHDILDKRSIKTIEAIHEEELDSILSDNMRFRKLNSFAMVLNGGAVEFVSVISFIIVAVLLHLGKITVGMTTAAFLYSTKFTDPICQLNVNIGKIKSVREIQDKLNSIIQAKSHSLLRCPTSIEKIEVQNVTKKFKQVQIEIPDMQFVYPNKYLIIGDNGAGKSVLFRMLMGFYKPDSGIIQYDELSEIDVSLLNTYVPQQPVIFEASYHDNVTLYGTYDDRRLLKYESYFPPELIERIKINITSKNLSGGEKQVIGLLRALCSEKPVLLLDEPFSAMNQATIEKFLSNINKINCMFIVIAHNVNEYSDWFEYVYTVHGKNNK